MKAAIRHMMRNRRRTILTLCAVLIPVYFLIMMYGFINSMMQDMFETATRFDTGHVQIRAEEVKGTGSAIPLIRDGAVPLNALASVDGIEWSTVRLDLPALASVGERTRTVYVRGLVPEEIDPVSNLSERMVEGSFLTSDSDGVLVGQELAELLELKVGDDMVLLGVHPDASLGAIRAPIVGIFNAPEANMGRSMVLASLATARRLARSDTAASAIVLRVDGVRGPWDTGELDKTVAALRAVLPAGYDVQDWLELVPFVKSYLAILTPTMVIMAIIFFGLGALVVVNTLYLSVMERTREIGLILALGSSRSRVMGMVLTEAGIITVAGAFYGALVGVGLVLIVQAFGGIPLWGQMAAYMKEMGINPVLNMSIRASQVLLSAGAMAVIALLAAWLPARRAANLEPMEAMRYVE
ncbi:MAG: ABC transporter permease [Candidatus Atribacteria bacterium]|nr:MAG: ABC transporter permease [Candidatus Atribacteria bacterium]